MHPLFGSICLSSKNLILYVKVLQGKVTNGPDAALGFSQLDDINLLAASLVIKKRKFILLPI